MCARRVDGSDGIGNRSMADVAVGQRGNELSWPRTGRQEAGQMLQ